MEKMSNYNVGFQFLSVSYTTTTSPNPSPPGLAQYDVRSPDSALIEVNEDL